MHPFGFILRPMFDLLIPIAHAQIPASLCASAECAAHCNLATGDIHFDCIPFYITDLTFLVISFAASLSVLVLMYNGFRYMFGPLTDGSTDAAKKGIMYAIIGLVVSLLAYAIIETIVINITS